MAFLMRREQCETEFLYPGDRVQTTLPNGEYITGVIIAVSQTHSASKMFSVAVSDSSLGTTRWVFTGAHHEWTVLI